MCYHKITANNTAKPTEFTMERTHNVAFIVASEVDALTQNSVAAKMPEPEKRWNTHAVQILWMVRLTQKGLQAIGPRVMT